MGRREPEQRKEDGKRWGRAGDGGGQRPPVPGRIQIQPLTWQPFSAHLLGGRPGMRERAGHTSLLPRS